MNKKKLRKLQTIPGNGKGQKTQVPPPQTIIITIDQGKVQVTGFPSNLGQTMDILHGAEKAVFEFFLNNLLQQAQVPQEPPKKREFMGPRTL